MQPVPLAGLCYSGEDGEGCVERGRGVKRNILERYEKDEYLEKVNVAPGMTSLYVIEGRSDLSSRE